MSDLRATRSATATSLVALDDWLGDQISFCRGSLRLLAQDDRVSRVSIEASIETLEAVRRKLGVAA